MTPSEFKAWFDGFTEAFSGCPTKVQWARIKARVAEIDGNAITERVYLERYWPTVTQIPHWTSFTSTCSSGLPFNSSTSMTDLGRAEAQFLAA